MSFEELNMEYNSQKSDLVMPEYGRSFQKLVKHCVDIEDDNTRQKFAERLIKLMTQMQPNYKFTQEHMEKLWNQMMMVADYKMNVEVPSDITITEHKDRPKPNRLAYPDVNKPYKHYGNNVLMLIDKATKMEDGPTKEIFINVIGSYMKLAYGSWSRDHLVNDAVIIADLKKISNGEIDLGPDGQLDYLKETMHQQAQQQYNKPKHKKRSTRKSHTHKKRRK